MKSLFYYFWISPSAAQIFYGSGGAAGGGVA